MKVIWVKNDGLPVYWEVDMQGMKDTQELLNAIGSTIFGQEVTITHLLTTSNQNNELVRGELNMGWARIENHNMHFMEDLPPYIHASLGDGFEEFDLSNWLLKNVDFGIGENEVAPNAEGNAHDGSPPASDNYNEFDVEDWIIKKVDFGIGEKMLPNANEGNAQDGIPILPAGYVPGVPLQANEGIGKEASPLMSTLLLHLSELQEQHQRVYMSWPTLLCDLVRALNKSDQIIVSTVRIP